MDEFRLLHHDVRPCPPDVNTVLENRRSVEPFVRRLYYFWGKQQVSPPSGASIDEVRVFNSMPTTYNYGIKFTLRSTYLA